MTTFANSKWSYRHRSYLPEKEFDDMISEMEWEGENLAEKSKEFLSLSDAGMDSDATKKEAVRELLSRK